MNIPARITVSAAEFTRQFGQLRHTLGDRPVHVTHHGRETHVLLSAARFDAMRALARRADREDNTPAGLSQWIHEGVIVLDSEGVVLSANPTAHALLSRPVDTLPGRLLWDVAPAISATPFDGIVRRAMLAREPATADLPSPFHADRWLQLDVHPAHDTVTILLRDITEDMRRDRLADVPKAVDRAATLHPGIARLHLNPRGHIVEAGPAACDMVGLASERLRGVALADLMPVARKPPFRAAFDAVMTDGEARCLASELLTNRGQAIGVAVTLAALRGCYGMEGAVMLATRSPVPPKVGG